MVKKTNIRSYGMEELVTKTVEILNQDPNNSNKRITKKVAKDYIASFIKACVTALTENKDGRNVKIRLPGLGTLYTKHSPRRVIPHPRNKNEKIEVDPTLRLRVVAGQHLKDLLKNQ